MLLHTINRAGNRIGKRLFLHFYDGFPVVDKFKEEEHPRGGNTKNAGQFSKGSGSSSTKPKAASNATIVNPIAKVLKEHGYEKQKGSNTFNHPTGHQVEVHAASEGQQWLTGWTHGTSGETGSGAGKLAKHLQSLPHDLPSAQFTPKKQEPASTSVGVKPIGAKPSVETGAASPHPLPKVHSALTDLGFTPTEQSWGSTTYSNPDKGEVLIDNTAKKKGTNKGKVLWQYTPPGGSVPIDSGYGVANGALSDAVTKHTAKQTPTMPTTPAVAAIVSTTPPPGTNYQHHETKWKGISGSAPDLEPADRYYTGVDSIHPEETLVIGKGPNNKDQWQLWTKQDGVVAVGVGQDLLNEEYAKLHPEQVQQAQSEPQPPPAAVNLTAPKDIEDILPKKQVKFDGGTIYSDASGSKEQVALWADNKWEIWQLGKGTVAQGEGQDSFNEAFEKLHPRDKNGHFITKPGEGEEQQSGVSKASIESLFKPLENKNFSTAVTQNGSIAGQLKTHPDDLKVAFSYSPLNPAEKSGSLWWQWPGETAQSEIFSGSAGDVYNQINQKYEEISKSPITSGSQHFNLTQDNPKELNGVKFSQYQQPTNSTGEVDWTNVEGQNEHLQEPEMVATGGKKISAGVLIEEPDGRVWIVKPAKNYGGYQYTFPKGGQEPGLSLQATAIKEAWEESGLKVEITGFAGDYEGDTSKTRYYLAKRTGGTPTGYQPDETEQVSLIPKEELHQYLNKARDLQIAKEHFTPKAIGRPIELSSLTKVGGQLGSNEGGTYQSASGKKYYVKIPATSEHAYNELLAAELMSKAGGGTLKYHAINGENGKLNVGTEWEALQKNNVSQLSPAEKKKAQADFAINAWLANWDAAGTGGDNTGILNGKAVTLDLGGALLYRAQGTPKGEAFDDNASEWESLRNTVSNPDAAKLYADMTPQQMKDSAAKLKSITNDDIHEAVMNWFDAAEGTGLIDKLIARRDSILAKAAAIPLDAPSSKTPAYGTTTTITTPTPTAPTANTYAKKHPDSNWSGKPEYQSLLKVAPKPTQKEGAAVYKYTGGDYRPWNQGLRSSLGYETDYPTNDLMQYLAKASFPEERTVKRRVDAAFANYLISQAADGTHEFTDHGFASSDHWSGKLTLRIKIPKGAQAAAVGNYSANHTEDEILIQAGSRYKITNFDEGSQTMDVELLRSGITETYAKQTGRPVGIWHKKPE